MPEPRNGKIRFVCFQAGNGPFPGTTTQRGTAEKIINVFHYCFLIVSNGREHEYKIGLLDRTSSKRHLDCLAGSNLRVPMDALSNTDLCTHRVDL
jgi:hypothetical protein